MSPTYNNSPSVSRPAFLSFLQSIIRNSILYRWHAGSGTGWSAQGLGLVRALFDRPQVLIVDEGISAIDADIENLVFKTLRAYAQHNAVFLISHNLRTLAKTDFLYLLENGAITTGGKPERLLETNKRFQELWHTQQGAGKLHVTMP